MQKASSKKFKQLNSPASAFDFVLSKAGWVVFAFALLLNLSSVFYDYNLDDELVTRNHRLTAKGLSAIPEIFTSPYYQDAQGYAYEYRPVVLTTFAIEHQFFGESSHVSHFINVLLYAVLCLLVFKVMQRLWQQVPVIYLLGIGLLFAAHTAHTEVVCSVKNRDEILALIFSTLAFIPAINIARKFSWKAAVLLVVCFSLALLSKTTILAFASLIPITITMFVSRNFARVMLVTALLIFPAFALLNLNSGVDRFIALAAMVLLVVIHFAVFCFNDVIQVVTGFRAKLPHISPANIAGMVNPGQKLKLKEYIHSVLPEKDFFKVLPAVLAMVICALYIYLTEYSNGWTVGLQVATVALLALTVLLGKGRYAWWANVAVAFCISWFYFAVKKETTQFDLFNICVVFYFALNIVQGSRVSFMPALIGYTVCTIAFMRPDGLLILALAALLYHGNLVARIIILVASVVTFITATFLSATLETPAILTAVFLVIMSVLPTIKYYSVKLTGFALLIAVFVLAFPLKSKTHNNLHQNVKGVVENINPQIIEKQDRPLHYVEQCVTMDDPLVIRTGTSMEILGYYLKNTILPYPLSFYYGYRFIKPVAITETLPLVSLLLYLILAGLAVYLMHKQPYIGYGLVFYLVTIVSFSDFFQFIPGMMADRYLLAPSLGWCMVLVFTVAWYEARRQKNSEKLPAVLSPPAKGILVAALLFYSGATIARNSYWKDDLTLFRHDIEYVSESAQAHNLLALHLMQHTVAEKDPNQQVKLCEEGLHHFKEAQKIYPNFFNVAYDIGRVYSMLNKPDSAIIAYEYAITLDSLLPDAYMRLADLHYNNRNFAKANLYLKRYILLQPTDYTGYSKLSYNLFLEKKFEESIQVNKEAIARIPGSPDPYINLSHTFAGLGKLDSAYAYMLQADRITPGNQQIQQSLADIRKKMESR